MSGVRPRIAPVSTRRLSGKVVMVTEIALLLFKDGVSADYQIITASNGAF